MTFKLNSEHVQSMPIQFGLILISFVCLVACLYKPITQFHPVDNKPHVQPINPEILAQWHAKDITYVHTGLTITDFLKFDAIKNEYIVNAIISFTFDASKVSPKAIDAFSFTKGDILKKSEPIITQQADNSTQALYYIRVQFTTIPDYKRFPLDDHYLYLNVTNTAVDPQKVIFQADADNYNLSENLYAHGWAIVEHQALAGYTTTQVAPNHTIIQPKMSFSIGLSKQDYRQLLLIILPLLVIFYFGIFAFSIKDIASAITLILSSVSGLIAYSFVIQTLSPAVGYLMLSDYMFLLFLAIIFAIFFITALNATPEHILSRKTIENSKSIAIIVIYLVLIGVWYYLTNIKDMC